jgi:fumarate hydratase class II
MEKFRIEKDSLGDVKVPNNCLWGAQTQRSLDNFNIGHDLMPREMIYAYAMIKMACAKVNYQQKKLPLAKAKLIEKVCKEILEHKHDHQFPLHVWMTGSGTQFNMNVNEVIANRISILSRKPLGSKSPVHPNDDVNMSQSSNDTFPTAMHIACALKTKHHLLKTLKDFEKTLSSKVKAWQHIVKLGRTHLQDAVPLTLGQEFSGYQVVIKECIDHIEDSLQILFELPLGGTALGTGINTLHGFDERAAKEIAKLSKLPFKTAKNKFAKMGSHHSFVHISGSIKSLACAVYKMVNDIRLLSCGPRAGLYELILPSNEPGSSIMPGKINPTQCEALSMVCLQAMASDYAVSLGDASGILDMNVYKPLIVYNLLHAITLMSDGISSFDKHCLKGIVPNRKKIQKDLSNSLMLVTALSPKIGYDKASKIAHLAFEEDISLKNAALKLGYVTEDEYDSIVKPEKMCSPTKAKK